jgi:hypothetical protein
MIAELISIKITPSRVRVEKSGVDAMEEWFLRLNLRSAT